MAQSPAPGDPSSVNTRSKSPTARRTSASPANSRSRPSSPGSTSTKSASPSEEGEAQSDPPLPDEDAPPLPEDAPPQDDGWDAMWDSNAQAYYFFNRYTHITQWDNPRVLQPSSAAHGSYVRQPLHGASDASHQSGAPGTSPLPRRRAGGYNPAIHGDYDPNADYAKETQRQDEEEEATTSVGSNPVQEYAATGHFNRFTGRFQNADLNLENHNDENKSRRQMNAFFDVDAAANTHDGRSLKAERRGKNLSKKELKAFKDKRREKKEEKRRAWLRD